MRTKWLTMFSSFTLSFFVLWAPNAVTDAPDSNATVALATEALIQLGANIKGSTHRCANCHLVDSNLIERWAENTLYAKRWCLNMDLNSLNQANAKQALRCLTINPAVENSAFDAHRMGVWTAAAHLNLFEKLFKIAFENQGEALHREFVAAVQMPRGGGDKLSEAQFSTILKWFELGLPNLKVLLGEDPIQQENCQTEVKPELINTIQELKVSGWKSLNEGVLHPFACASQGSCFDQKNHLSEPIFPLSSSLNWAESIANPQIGPQKVHVLRTLPYTVSYWVRSSPDGRFVSHGKKNSSRPSQNSTNPPPNSPPSPAGQGGLPIGGAAATAPIGSPNGSPEVDGLLYGAVIQDLQGLLNPNLNRVDIWANASFDPGFFPDNSGFSLQGNAGGSVFCRLQDLVNPNIRQISFLETFCTRQAMSLYHSVGSSLGGQDHFAITGGFNADSAWGDNVANFPKNSTFKVYPMIFNGLTYDVKAPISVSAARQGDFIVSPSSKLVVGRFGSQDPTTGEKRSSYKINILDVNLTSNPQTANIYHVGTICESGAKATFSYDERFLAYHHKVSISDFRELGFESASHPDFMAMINKDTINSFVYDLLAKRSYRLTQARPGQKAVFPHFRTDNWLYFLLKDTDGNEHLMATDFATRL